MNILHSQVPKRELYKIKILEDRLLKAEKVIDAFLSYYTSHSKSPKHNLLDRLTEYKRTLYNPHDI